MKILSIRIKNIASIEGPFHIDFTTEPLNSAGIFAITGPTGAGKSTILDAICLALFARTPRHIQAKEKGIEIADVAKEKISPGDVKNILRKGTSDGFAEVDFRGVDGKNYKAGWYVKRARNKIEGSLQPDSIELTNIDTNTKFQGRKNETLDEIERLIGLNFEQFTRSVLLAQGDFTAFLKAEKKEKSSLLEKLTGTDIYSEISKLIYQKCKETETEVRNLEKQIEGIKLHSDEETLYIKNQMQLKQQEIALLQNENEKIVADINWHLLHNELLENKINAENSLLQVVQNKENCIDRIYHLQQVELVQSAEKLIEKRKGIEVTIAGKKTELDDAIKQIEANEELLRQANLIFEQAKTHLTLLDNEFTNAKPNIEKAKELDIQIREKGSQLELAKIDANKATENKKVHIGLITNKNRELEFVKDRIASLCKWKDTNSNKKPVAENKVLILAKLEEGKKSLNKVSNNEKEIQTAQIKRDELVKHIKIIEDKQKIAETDLLQLKNKITEKQNEIDKYQIVELKETEKQQSKLYETTISAIGCWEILYNNIIELDKCKNSIFSIRNIIEKNKSDYILYIDKKKEAEIKRDLSAKMVAKAELETADNVISLRNNLSPDEECPVCGSKHHPFASGKTTDNIILKHLRDEFSRYKTEFEKLLQHSTKLKQTIDKDGELLDSLIKNETEKSEIVFSRNKEWQLYKINVECLKLPDSEKLKWLIHEKNIIKNELDRIRKSIVEYDNVVIEVTELKRNSEINIQTLYKIKEEVTIKQNQLHNLCTEIDRLKNDNIEHRKYIQNIVNELNQYFVIEKWHENWLKNPIDFENKIDLFATEWNSKIQELEGAENEKNKLSNDLEHLCNQLESYNSIEISAIQNLNNQCTDLDKFSIQRKVLFGDKKIETVENEFQDKIKAAKIKVEEAKNKADKLSDVLNKIHGKQQQISTDIETLGKNLLESKIELELYVTDFNLKNENKINEEILYQLLSYPNDWLKTEKDWYNSIIQSITNAENTLHERSQQLESHLQKKRTELSEEELKNELTDKKDKSEILNKEKNELEFRLRQDSENYKQKGDIFKKLESINKIYSVRQNLNDLIGSADGEKFRLIAQGYTLDILLGYANIHLKDLSPRYNLERIPDSLALQVFDNDMGNEIRSVHSLSGGESFLVSLALALGLASLSSNKMKVESLFIDEGFGSLDSTTLGIAMDALERLQNQGRKVGVISHVEEMSERIQTKIRVIKLTNGKSRLEVVG